MKPWPWSASGVGAGGLTHVELLLALLITVLICAAGFAAARAAAAAFARLDGGDLSDAEAALDVIGRDLRCAALDPDDNRTRFVCHADDDGHARLRFARALSADELVSVSFSLAPSAGGGQELRRVTTALAEGSGGEPAFLCGGVTEFRCRFFGADVWSSDWDWDAEHRAPIAGIRGLPLLVGVTLGVRTPFGERRLNRTFPVMVALLNRSLHE
ncbi:MAG: hypothetical protein JO102_03950 [Elusimicrobia bacterium]|nr:hypothetical protein [Elusimicrobiota bacterium]